MEEFIRGHRKALAELIGGLSQPILLEMLEINGYVPNGVVQLYYFFNIIAGIAFISKIRSWGFYYLLGWLLGSFAFYAAGHTSEAEFNLYFTIPFFILIIKGIKLFLQRLA